jgi:hypothetical protein
MSQKLYNTGFIKPSEPIIRLKQGLSTHNVSNVCLYTGALCEQRTLYPIEQTRINNSFSNNC